MSLFGGLGSALWQGAKNVGDFVGLDGSFGYQGTWNNNSVQMSPAGLNSINGGQYSGYNSISQPTANVGGSSLVGSLADWFSKQNSQDWKNYGNIFKDVGGIGLGYMNYKQGEKIADAQLQQMALDQQYQEEAERRRRINSQNANLGFQNSSLGQMIQ